MARATQRYDFSTFAAPVALTQVEVIDFLRSTIDPAHRERFVEVARLEQALTDIDDQGIVGVFGVEKAKEIISIVRRLNAAVAA